MIDSAWRTLQVCVRISSEQTNLLFTFKLTWNFSPEHFPSGSIQVLVLKDLPAPQVAEQGLHFDHDDQPPNSAEKKSL